ncbi:MAG: hypothetical protein H7Y33_14110, partial [Cytophagales bacterium]|nr:hypothetical protein [Rhizobacter sp.]
MGGAQIAYTAGDALVEIRFFFIRHHGTEIYFIRTWSSTAVGCKDTFTMTPCFAQRQHGRDAPLVELRTTRSHSIPTHLSQPPFALSLSKGIGAVLCAPFDRLRANGMQAHGERSNASMQRNIFNLTTQLAWLTACIALSGCGGNSDSPA